MNEPTSHIPEQSEENKAGIIGLVLSCIGLFICVFSLPGLIFSIIGTRKEPRTAAIIGVVLGSIGMLFGLLLIPLSIGLLLPALSKARESARMVNESRQLDQIHKGMLLYSNSSEHDANEQAGTPHEAWKSESVKKQIGNDSWGNPYRVQGDGTTVPKINSAGPDGVHDTEDDITPSEPTNGN